MEIFRGILPKEVVFIFSALEQHNAEAFIVGGSVRNILLGFPPDDWDITTSALPEQIVGIFKDYHIITTGIKHGTVGVVIDHKLYEITTYRHDGGYSDFRHPDKVEFTKSVREDLARRDFTINAIAYNPKVGLLDFFGGREDLHRRLIRTVGDPYLRFNEDALRILRGVRFSSQLGFDLEENTNSAMRELSGNLDKIAKERVQTELIKTLLGDNVEGVLLNQQEIIAHIIPELKSTIGFHQHSKYHQYDVYTHTAKSVANSKKDVIIRLTMLLHDVGKPASFLYDENDNSGHFKGHEKIGAKISEEILKRLKFSSNAIKKVPTLIYYHDVPMPQNEIGGKKLLGRLGLEMTELLLEVKLADASAKAPLYSKRAMSNVRRVQRMIEKIVKENQCYSIEQLALDGDAIIGIGIPKGKKVGIILGELLKLVIEEKIPNEKTVLISKAKAIAGSFYPLDNLI